MRGLIEPELEALRYVRNTGGGATRAHFVEDHEPIGHQLWAVLSNQGLIRVDENARIFLTDAGLALI
jgi:hypothetical protein